MASTLYLKCYEIEKTSNGVVLVKTNVKTYLVYFISKYCNFPSASIPIVFVNVKNDEAVCHSLAIQSKAHLILCAMSSPDCKFVKKSDLDKRLTFCVMPFLVNEKLSYFRSGISCILRSIVLSNLNFVHLLGPTRGCLKACAEVSSWTMFCENHIPQSLKNFLFSKNHGIIFLKRIEELLSMPSTVTNMKKTQKQLKLKGVILNNAELSRYHPFIEGFNFTLTDIIIYSAIVFIITSDINFKNEILVNFPKVAAYFSALNEITDLKKTVLDVLDKRISFPKIIQDLLPANSQIYFKKKIKISSSLTSLNTICNICTKYELFLKNDDYVNNWTNLLIPGNMFEEIKTFMPYSRFEKKCDQLRNMAQPVVYFSNKIHRIVDFCAGSGQLGILISLLFPQHEILIVENKEESISKCLPFVSKAKNIAVHQTNLDYFQQPFDLGMCLHGCGFVSDLVLQKCIKYRAIFVICPCCYGSIKETSDLTYPQSCKIKQVLSYDEFLSVAHTADQTQKQIIQEEVGVMCMSIIDMDRFLKAQESNYKTFIYKMQPTSCSPKNNLIVGIPLERL